jgi:acyl-CoA synthetase (AMP-forming)/AMP-acid ligase II
MFIGADTGNLTEVVSGRHWEPAEVRRQVAMRVASYSSLGLERGDRVLIIFGNRLEFFAELLAVWSLGGCAIPVDRRLTGFEVRKLADVAQPRIAVVDENTDVQLIDNLAGAQVVNTLEHDVATVKGVRRSDPKLDDDALILFTSGSTGQPKGVVHTHRSLQARWATLRQSLGVAAYRRTLCLLPTHFGHGLICNCLFPWLSGCDLFIAPPFKPDLIVQLGPLLDEHRITFMSSVPSMWTLALRTAKPPRGEELRRLHVGSAPLSESMWRQIQEWSGIRDVFNAYGITETGSWVAGTTGGAVEPEDGLIGTPWGAAIKVLRARSVEAVMDDDSCCGVDEEGMIWLNTPALMKGYFKRQDLTDAVVHQGWFMTGDIGIIDARDHLLIRGRERDEINKGGMKVFPADVDAVVEQHEYVTDVCTFGIGDVLYGENVAIAVVLRESTNDSIRSVHEWIEVHLAEHKRPARWYILEDIPRTSRGKINRDTVRQTCEAQQPFDLATVLAEAR